MSIKIHIPSDFLSYTNNKELLEVSGTTVEECLQELVSHFPEFKKTITTLKDGKVIYFLDVFVNGKYFSPEKPVKDGDEIIIKFGG